MFDIGWSELLVIGVVALIAIGPKELPSVLRTVGYWIGRIRRMASEFQGQFQEALREAEMEDLKKHVDEINESTRDLTTHFDPLEGLHPDSEPAQVEHTAETPALPHPAAEPEKTHAPEPLAASAEEAPVAAAVTRPALDEASEAAPSPAKAAAGGAA